MKRARGATDGGDQRTIADTAASNDASVTSSAVVADIATAAATDEAKTAATNQSVAAPSTAAAHQSASAPVVAINPRAIALRISDEELARRDQLAASVERQSVRDEAAYAAAAAADRRSIPELRASLRRELHRITGDGDCMFHAFALLLWFIWRSVDRPIDLPSPPSHFDLRQLFCNYVAIESATPGAPTHHQLTPLQLAELRTPGVWSTHPTMFRAHTILARHYTIDIVLLDTREMHRHLPFEHIRGNGQPSLDPNGRYATRVELDAAIAASLGEARTIYMEFTDGSHFHALIDENQASILRSGEVNRALIRE